MKTASTSAISYFYMLHGVFIFCFYLGSGLVFSADGDALRLAASKNRSRNLNFVAEDRPLASEASAETSFRKWGVGYSVSSLFTGSATTVTGMVRINPQDYFQGHLAIPSTSPSFELTCGFLYKKAIKESENAGLHLGGGMSFGSMRGGSGNEFVMFVGPVGGIHFSLGNARQVQFHFDGGPTFRILNNNNNFVLGAYSSLLGASVLYWF